jgi:hypothetical protein
MSTNLTVDSDKDIKNLIIESKGSVVIDTYALYEEGRVLFSHDGNKFIKTIVRKNDIKRDTTTEETIDKVIEQAEFLYIWPRSSSPLEDK